MRCQELESVFPEGKTATGTDIFLIRRKEEKIVVDLERERERGRERERKRERGNRKKRLLKSDEADLEETEAGARERTNRQERGG